jgi:hypothetical protein
VIADPARARVEADLAEPRFVSGLRAGRWRILGFAFPILDFAVSATEPDGKPSEYGFQAELSNYPGVAPYVRIWDHAARQPLAQHLRPKGGPRVQVTFQVWTDDTVYRPWERRTGPHSSNSASLQHLAWWPERRLSFIFEDLHGILNANAIAHALRTCT